MAKHAQAEAPLEKADRLITELEEPDQHGRGWHHPANLLHCWRIGTDPNGDQYRILGGPG
ncbi:hypothetical protein [Glutamicibacter arilaitensis]|uniref:hypothetical protein n=1 Tax=Glutamicibacter arilaitensis TaxID=256701 RepID=UPI003FD6B7D7